MSFDVNGDPVRIGEPISISFKVLSMEPSKDGKYFILSVVSKYDCHWKCKLDNRDGKVVGEVPSSIVNRER